MTTAKQKAQTDLVVGLVILAVTAATIAAILWMQRSEFGQRRREVVARFRDAGNVRPGNSVTVRGVESGRVDRLQLADSGWVFVTVKLEPDVELPPDPVMILFQQSLFGEWAATFVTRNVAAAISDDVGKQLLDASGAPELPGVVLPDNAQLTAVAGQIAGSFSRIADRFGRAFDDTAALELRGTFRSTASLARELEAVVRRQSRRVDSIGRGLDDAVSTADSALKALERTMGRVEQATSAGEVERLVRDANETAAALRDAAVNIRDLSRELASDQGIIVSAAARADTVLARLNAGEGTLGLLLRDPGVYRQTDSLLIELRGLIADVKANPRKYVNLRVF
jgi:phospholipid/cholesterol/gamma-HCH transport system substrate-binding protein